MRTALLITVAFVVGAPAAEDAVPDPAKPYKAKKSAPVNYDIDFRVIVTAPAETQKLRVWVPVPQDDEGQKVTDGEWSVFPTDVKPTFHTEKVFGNRFAYFEFADPKGAQIISHTFKATVWQLDWDVKQQDVEEVKEWPAAFEPYRRAEPGIVINDKVKQLASGLESGRGSARDIELVMSWVNSNLTYDHSISSLEASTEHALKKRRGDCSDFHGLCASLGRALGVPTRITYGMHLFPKNAPAHCKLEAYLHPYGWVSFDVSETQRLMKAIDKDSPRDRDTLTLAALQRLRRGFRDNTWLLMTKGTDYVLAPPARQKVPLISTIHAEADGRALPVPDPADVIKREFAWMTAHKFTPDREVTYPFKDWTLLRRK